MSAPAEGAKQTFITENGCASDDVIADDGNIDERNGFSTSHVARRSCGATPFWNRAPRSCHQAVAFMQFHAPPAIRRGGIRVICRV
jgi:hypothetical protein